MPKRMQQVAVVFVGEVQKISEIATSDSQFRLFKAIATADVFDKQGPITDTTVTFFFIRPRAVNQEKNSARLPQVEPGKKHRFFLNQNEGRHPGLYLRTASDMRCPGEMSPVLSSIFSAENDEAELERAKQQGIDSACRDIDDGKYRILYFGQPRSKPRGKPNLDPQTGFRVHEVAGCIVSAAYAAEVQAYNQTMRAHVKNNQPRVVTERD